MRQCFIAIATGQNVANIPPILQRAQPGDAVLWLESSQAIKNAWASGANEVLKRRRLTVLDPLLIPDDPAAIAATLLQHSDRWRGYTPMVVLNGGTKLTPLALHQAFSGRGTTFLYGMDRPAELWVFDRGIDHAHQREHYNYPLGTLTLLEILACSGHVVVNPDKANCFWPAGTPPSTIRNGYGELRDVTVTAHDEAYREGLSRKQTPEGNVHFDALPELVHDKYHAWLRGCMGPLNAARHLPKGTTEPPEEFIPRLGPLFHGSIKLYLAAERASRLTERPEHRLGPVFEAAVANRVYHWLARDSSITRFVNEAWSSVKIASKNDPHKVVAELDIVLVLRNGLLLSLECKSFDAEQKDLDARLLNLREVASRLARMAVCGPLYTDCASETWFEQQHDLRTKINEHSNISYLPFTLPGQPMEYNAPGLAAENSEIVRIEAFETALAAWVKPYRPHD